MGTVANKVFLFEMMALHCEASAEAEAAPAESAAPESECAPSPITQIIFDQLDIELRGSKRFRDKGLLEEDEYKGEKTATLKRYNDAMNARMEQKMSKANIHTAAPHTHPHVQQPPESAKLIIDDDRDDEDLKETRQRSWQASKTPQLTALQIMALADKAIDELPTIMWLSESQIIEDGQRPSTACLEEQRFCNIVGSAHTGDGEELHVWRKEGMTWHCSLCLKELDSAVQLPPRTIAVH